MKTALTTLSSLMALAAASVQAQTITSIGTLANESDGDLVLVFSNTITPPMLAGEPQDLLVDIGPASDYYSTANALAGENKAVAGGLAPGTTYNVAAYNPADLANVFGTNANNANTRWAVLGGNGDAGGPGAEPAMTLWLTSSGAAFTANKELIQARLSPDLDAATNDLFGAAGLTSAVATERPANTATSFANILGPAGTLQDYSGVVANSTTANLVSGGSSSLELYELLPTDANRTGGPSVVDLGTFTLTGTGLTFTAFSPLVPPPSGGGRIVNLSARANVGTGGNILIAGFVIRGTGSKNVLLRGVGPTLGTEFSVPGVLTQPQLTLISGAGTTLSTDAGWGGNATLSNAFADVGAFALAANSADSAMLKSLPVGLYTSQVAGVSGTSGVALAEIYDADSGTPTSNLVNISARANVGSGADGLIAGFVIDGGQTTQVLLRGVGPALSAFGVSDPLAQPSIFLYDSKSVLMSSDSGWGNALSSGPSNVSAIIRPATAADMNGVGAFALPSGSADSAMVASLPPGSYTVQVGGINGSSGVGLVEVYLMP